MGRILSAAWQEAGRGRLPEPSFTSHLATVLAMMARDGRGLVWSPLSLVADDIAAGRLIRIGAPDDEIMIEIHLFRPRARQSQAAERFWQRVQEQERQVEKKAQSSSNNSSGFSS